MIVFSAICLSLIACSSEAPTTDNQGVKSGQIYEDLEHAELLADQFIIQQHILSSHPPNNLPEEVDQKSHLTITYDCEGRCLDGEYSIFKEIIKSSIIVPCDAMFLYGKISLSKKGKQLWSVYLANTEDRLHYMGQCYRISHDLMPRIEKQGILVWNDRPIKYDLPVE